MKKITFQMNGLFFNDLPVHQKNVVYVDGKFVPYGEHNQSDYTWGYKGGGPMSLTKSIMKLLGIPESSYEELYEKISCLPKFKNFSRNITITCSR